MPPSEGPGATWRLASPLPAGDQVAKLGPEAKGTEDLRCFEATHSAHGHTGYMQINDVSKTVPVTHLTEPSTVTIEAFHHFCSAADALFTLCE